MLKRWLFHGWNETLPLLQIFWELVCGIAEIIKKNKCLLREMIIKMLYIIVTIQGFVISFICVQNWDLLCWTIELHFLFLQIKEQFIVEKFIPVFERYANTIHRNTYYDQKKPKVYFHDEILAKGRVHIRWNCT